MVTALWMWAVNARPLDGVVHPFWRGCWMWEDAAGEHCERWAAAQLGPLATSKYIDEWLRKPWSAGQQHRDRDIEIVRNRYVPLWL